MARRKIRELKAELVAARAESVEVVREGVEREPLLERLERYAEFVDLDRRHP